jgi:serine/threonine protein kinase
LDIRICDFGSAALVPESGYYDNITTPIIPGTPVSLNSQSLTDGIGRGTLPYSPPELLFSGSTYSFPVDMYSAGVLLFVVISQCQPFPQHNSPIHLIHAIRRGFFAPENQPLVKGWKNPDPSDGQWMFPSRELVPKPLVDIIFSLTDLNPESRPTATALLSKLIHFETLKDAPE